MAYERISCPKCTQTFGQESRFYDHLTDAHGIEDHFNLYLELYFNGIHPTCSCSEECKEKLSWSGWKKGFQSKYFRGHNAKVDSVYLNPGRQKDFASKRSAGYSRGDYSVWNSGLTKATSEKLQRSASKTSVTLKDGYSSGKYTPWQAGKTKEDCSVLKAVSETKKQKFASRETRPWNEGLTKETHPTIEIISQKVSAAYDRREMGRRLSVEDLLRRISVFSDRFTLVSDPSEYKTRRIDRLVFRCVKCNDEQSKSLAMLEESPVCFSCSPKESKGQLEVYEFVKSLGVGEVLSSDRSVIAPKEIDVWIPSARLGIEYNGLYWHSSSVLPDPSYHIDKEVACNLAGISLLSIFEDEWRDKRHIVEGMIRHRLKIPGVRRDARKLSLATLTHFESNKFFDDNHLEGYVAPIETFCLKDPASGIVLAALSLRRPFHKKYEDRFEVARCACLVGHNVRGWLGRLSSAALEYARNSEKKGLMTYVDARVGSGSGYAQSGWKIESLPKSPRFWWTDYTRRYNRFKFRADSKRGLTQEQVASAAGVVKLWGCSNFTYFMDV